MRALPAVLALALGGAASAQKPAADAAPAKAAPRYTIAAADKDLHELAAGIAAFESCVEALDWMTKDLERTEKAQPAQGGAPSAAMPSLAAIKKNRLGAARPLCEARKNDLGTEINVLASRIAAIWPPTDPGIKPRRDALAAYDEKYLSACAKAGWPAKKVVLELPVPLDTSPPKLPQTKKQDPPPPQPSRGDAAGFNRF